MKKMHIALVFSLAIFSSSCIKPTRNSTIGGAAEAGGGAASGSTVPAGGTPIGASGITKQKSSVTNALWKNRANAIYFYENKPNEYYEFANFWDVKKDNGKGIHLDGRYWPTSEHYFQANKFKRGTPEYNAVAASARPRDAFNKARSYASMNPNRVSGWQTGGKLNVMRKALHAKYTQVPRLKDLLVATGNKVLIEDSPYDDYWGTSTQGQRRGRNWLGYLLMELRGTLTNSKGTKGRGIPAGIAQPAV